MRFNDEFLMELRQRADIENIISSYVNIKRAGRISKGVCPFHNEKTPSFTVYPDTQSYYCFGCGNGGDVVTFIKNIENLKIDDKTKQNTIGFETYTSEYEDENGKSQIVFTIDRTF